jgi:hypothetical protein
MHSPLSMIFLRYRSAEECKDPVACGLHYVTLVPLDGVHHESERGVYDGACILRIEFLDQCGRAPDIGEQRGDSLAFVGWPGSGWAREPISSYK